MVRCEAMRSNSDYCARVSIYTKACTHNIIKLRDLARQNSYRNKAIFLSLVGRDSAPKAPFGGDSFMNIVQTSAKKLMYKMREARVNTSKTKCI